MLCSHALELIEPLAAGDMALDGATRAHFETCPRCAAALASARRLEAMLKAAAAPEAPAGFTSAVIQRIHGDRWRSEQRVDRLFNIAIAAAVLLVGCGIVAMLNVNTVVSMAATSWTLLGERLHAAVREAAPALISYVAAAGLLASALAMWWWAERRLQF